MSRRVGRPLDDVVGREGEDEVADEDHVVEVDEEGLKATTGRRALLFLLTARLSERFLIGDGKSV